MTVELQNVKPGDLITADWWNALVETLSSLEGRVAVLEASSSPLAPVLIRRDPLGDVEAGSVLTLVGRNFVQPVEQNTVTLGSEQVKLFKAGSDDEHLIFEVPVFSALPVSLPVAVHNQHGDSGTLVVRVIEHVEAQEGEVVFFPRSASGQSPQPGQTLRLEWDVDAQTTLPENFTFNAVYVNPVGATQALWELSATLVPTNATITRGAAQRVTLTVVVPAGAQSIDIALRAVALDHAQLTKTSSPMSVTVGQSLPVSDPRTAVSLQPLPPNTGAGTPNPARTAVINGTSGVEVQRGQEALLLVLASSTVPGKYAFSTQVEQGGAAWETRVEPATRTFAATAKTTLAVFVRNAENAAGPARFMVVRATKRNAADTADEFVSFVRFPVRGFAS